MAQSAHDTDYEWYRPDLRGIIPIDNFHISHSLRRFAHRHKNQIEFRFNDNFESVMRHCAARDETWINEPIIYAFALLHRAKLAHALAVYYDDKIAGGVYGLALGGAFFGESMFSTKTNGSKLALWALTSMLKNAGFSLFDTQFLTPHLESLGGVEIPDKDYQKRLDIALEAQPDDISNEISFPLSQINSNTSKP